MFIECNQNEVICAMGTQVMSTFYRLPFEQGDNIQGHNINEIDVYCILLLLIDLFYANPNVWCIQRSNIQLKTDYAIN